jgi:hypothetical protein
LDVIDAIGDGSAELFVDKVMGLDPHRSAARLVLDALVRELTD